MISAPDRFSVILAENGQGKTVMSTKLREHLPQGSCSVVFDCFGDGGWRNVSTPRYRAQDVLVQVANELASVGLCNLLIPNGKSDEAYFQAFSKRMQQANDRISSRNEDSLVCLIFDAADNAVMAENEPAHTGKSFLAGLLTLTLPERVRVVFTARPSRRDSLGDLSRSKVIKLGGFKRDETVAHVRTRFPQASEQIGRDFHWRTSGNPRVQAKALKRAKAVGDLCAVRPGLTVDQQIDALLDVAIGAVTAGQTEAERASVTILCRALATLRPSVPYAVLAAMTGLPAAAVRDFTLQFDEAFHVGDDLVRFRDEATEDWFKRRYEVAPEETAVFANGLKPIAAQSAYAASVLPGLMLRAGQLREVIDLALSDDALPSDPTERREVVTERLDFALRAALKAKRHAAAVPLAFRLGSERAGQSRLKALVRENTDLFAAVQGSDRAERLVAERTLETDGRWLGARHAYEAGLLCWHDDHHAEARSAARIGWDSLRAWYNQPTKDRSGQGLEADDLTEFALAALKLDGPAPAVRRVQAMRPRSRARSLVYDTSCRVIRRLIDHADWTNVDALCAEQSASVPFLLAANAELVRVGRTLPNGPGERLYRTITRFASRRRAFDPDGLDYRHSSVATIAALIQSAIPASIGTVDEHTELLGWSLPAISAHTIEGHSANSGGRDALLRAVALHAALCDRRIAPNDVVPSDSEREPDRYGDIGRARALLTQVLPWYAAWAASVVGNATSPLPALPKTSELEDERRRFNFLADDALRLHCEVLLSRQDQPAAEEMVSWCKANAELLTVGGLASAARTLARHEYAPYVRAAHKVATVARAKLAERGDAEERLNEAILVARAVLYPFRDDASGLLDHAADAATRLGDENLQRWEATLDLIAQAGRVGTLSAELAHEASRLAELADETIYKGFDWGDIGGLLGAASPGAALTIASRWRDRGVGDENRYLPPLIDSLVERGELSAVARAALYCGTRAYWPAHRIVGEALDSVDGSDKRGEIGRRVLRYARWRDVTDNTFCEIRHAFETHGLNISYDLERLSSADAKRASRENRHEGVDQRPAATVFEGLTVWSPADLAEANVRFRAGSPPWYGEVFIAAAADHVLPGKEGAFIDAVALLPRFGTFGLRDLLRAIPEGWQDMAGVEMALRSAVQRVVRTEPYAVQRRRFNSLFPRDELRQFLHGADEWVDEATLEAAADFNAMIDTPFAFGLVSLLAPTLTETEVHGTLQGVISQVSSELSDREGGGSWTPALTPPGNTITAFAGWLWTRLGAPIAQHRWEAAHVVRSLCAFGATRELESLRSFASGGNEVAAFTGQGFVFYELHARLWLSLALDRAARENPGAVRAFAPILTGWRDGDHALIREVAERALIGLGVDSFERVNAPRQAPVPAGSLADRTDEFGATGEADEATFRFGMDIRPSWYDPLGSRFGISAASVERRALTKIRTVLNHPGSSRWDDDQRHVRRAYSEGSTYFRHDYPQADDLNFYLCFHAMMFVAVDLHAELPARSDWGEVDPFLDWLSRYDVQRADRAWLADGRGHPPADRNLSAHAPSLSNADWQWSIQAGDFAERLCNDGRLIVHGHWKEIHGDAVEVVQIGSALVTPDRSVALLRAAQDLPDLTDYFIPYETAERDEDEYHARPFVLDPFVARPNSEPGSLDMHDPWANEVQSPPIVLSSQVRQALLERPIEPDGWATWSVNTPPYRERDGDHPFGHRLDIEVQAALQVLRDIDRDLLIDVRIERTIRQYGYGSRYDHNALEYLHPYRRFFLINRTGAIRTF
ncbi:NACHT domain-containing protein [Parvularcula oceani]|uniref:NACHT domain-containing protein n=1 Tax=Parvularcula oceani TaxID=1247963 RepID=UPI002351F059|nr:NACHT domain-containing protein [Parvularcula oceani]